MTAECPFCFVRVHIGPDGVCPACRGQAHSATEHDKRWTAVMIRAGHSLPCCCFLCGGDTRQAKTFCFEVGQGHVPDGLLDRLAMLGAAVALFSLMVFKRRVRLRKALPVCAACAATRPTVMPLQVMPEQEALRLRVHREFRRQFEELNADALVE